MLFLTALFFSCRSIDQRENNAGLESLPVQFNGDASIEVGNNYVGLEFHHSSPMPQRISFYYPVANSIDMSTDYWTRDETHSMMAALKVGNGDFEWLGLDQYKTDQTPYYVHFSKSEDERDIQISYEFLQNYAAFQVKYSITNTTESNQNYELYTDLQASLKTSHTYALKKEAWTETAEDGNSLIINYEDDEVGNTSLVSTNLALQPNTFSTKSEVAEFYEQGNWWESVNLDLNNKILNKENPRAAAFRYSYSLELAPGETMEVVQIFGATDSEKGEELIQILKEQTSQEIESFESQVREYIQEYVFVTGDDTLDHSIQWAKAILNVNRHFIDGSIQPMPCPAQYNFYFTHDVLLTDLAAVNFDLPRVKSDLEFIVRHADEEHTIPHAYYWKDHDFQTEIAPTDNWNHFWFVIVSASYLRHSGDTAFLGQLYPYLEKSVHDFSVHNKNGIIYSYRPDWWDIARNFGPRSYTTILASKALRDFQYIASELGKEADELTEREQNIAQIKESLNAELWDETQQYLTNYFEDKSQDEHYYIGSLLGSHYGLLDADRTKQLTQTANEKLVDPKIGVYTVYPMDFQNLIEYLKLAGNEAGDAHYYINGGIWPHGNAWYLLSMIESGDRAEAYEFIKNIMTVKGVMNSPNGYPAMYEYRVSKKDDPEVYGQIDKPQFTWAAGWYLYGLFNLFGIRETEWNIRLNPYLEPDQEKVQFDLTHSGRKLNVVIKGEGGFVESVRVNGKIFPGLVLPNKLPKDISDIEVTLSAQPNSEPMLLSLEAKLIGLTHQTSQKKLKVEVEAFAGHQSLMNVLLPEKPVVVLQNETELREDQISIQKQENGYLVSINFEMKSTKEMVEIRY